MTSSPTTCWGSLHFAIQADLAPIVFESRYPVSAGDLAALLCSGLLDPSVPRFDGLPKKTPPRADQSA